MSLINKMLQDLEERQSGAETLGSLHGAVRAAPEPRSRAMLWPTVAIAAALLAAVAAGVWWMNTQQVETQSSAAPQVIAQEPSLSLKLDHLPSTPPIAATGQAISNAALALQNFENPLQNEPVQARDTETTPGEQQRVEAAVAAHGIPANAALSPSAVGTPKQAPDGAPSTTAARSAPAPDTKQVRPERVGSAVPAKAVTSAREKSRQPESAEAVAEAEPMPVKLSKQIKELTPSQHAENEYRRALGLIEQGRSKEAMSALEMALHHDARHVTARQTLAALLLDGNRADEAMRKVSEGLSLDKTQLGLAMMMARLQVDRQEVRAAIDTLQRSLPHAVERADYRAFLAALLQREARHKEAIDHYLAALRKTPNNGIWWMGIGISLHAESRIPEARDAFSRSKMSGTLSPDLLAFVEQKLAQLR